MNVSLTCSESHARIIMTALDLFFRVNLGQFDEAWRYVEDSPEFNDDGREVARTAAAAMKAACFPLLEPGASYGITSPHVSTEAKIACEIHQTMRYAISWAKNPDGGMTVNFDEPLKLTGEPLPSVACAK
jgi:hypothetical protein